MWQPRRSGEPLQLKRPPVATLLQSSCRLGITASLSRLPYRFQQTFVCGKKMSRHLFLQGRCRSRHDRSPSCCFQQGAGVSSMSPGMYLMFFGAMDYSGLVFVISRMACPTIAGCFAFEQESVLQPQHLVFCPPIELKGLACVAA